MWLQLYFGGNSGRPSAMSADVRRDYEATKSMMERDRDFRYRGDTGKIISATKVREAIENARELLDSFTDRSEGAGLYIKEFIKQAEKDYKSEMKSVSKAVDGYRSQNPEPASTTYDRQSAEDDARSRRRAWRNSVGLK